MLSIVYNPMKKILPLFIALLSLTLIWVLFFWQPSNQVSSQSNTETENKLPIGGKFNLQSAQGDISLDDYRGKVLLIYFGYTWCPDVCPTNLAMMGAALSHLDSTESNKVQGLFVSVDPERDNIQRLAEYSAFFHESIIGATASPKQIKEIATRYGSVYRKVEQDSATDYVVDHSSETYVVDPAGNLVERLPHAALPEEILNSVRKYL